MIYIELFMSFFQIGLFAFGGGYAALPLIQTKVVDTHGWLTLAEFTDVLTISQMTPGPIGINAATFVGTRMAGISGAIVATLGCVAPSFIIVLILAYIYVKYNNLKIIQGILQNLRPAIVGLIAASGLSIVILTFWNGANPPVEFGKLDIQAVVLFAASIFVLARWKINPVYIMAGTGLAGFFAHIMQ